MISFNNERDLREYIGKVLEEKINFVISRRVAEGMLNEIKADIVKQFEVKLAKLDALDRITIDIKKLFDV